MKHGVMAYMRLEQQRWQLASGLVGGWPALLIVLPPLLGGWILFFYLLTRPIAADSWAAAILEPTAGATNILFLGAIMGYIVVLRQRREHTLLQLCPNVRPLIAAINRRLASLALLCLIPAIALSAFSPVRRYDSLDALISLADVPAQGFLSAGLLLIYLAALVVITFGWLHAPLRFAFLPIYWGATYGTVSLWPWLPLVACIIIVIGHRLWLRTDMASVVHVQTAERRRQFNLIERFNSWHLQRAARGAKSGNASERAIALLSNQKSRGYTSLVVAVIVFYFAFKPGFVSHASGWFFTFMVGAFVSKLSPIPLTRIALLPLNAQRTRMGKIIAAVWLREVQTRLLLGVPLGMLAYVFFWWIEWPAFAHAPVMNAGSTTTRLLWNQLAHAASVYGIALSVCLVASASPKLLERASFPASMLFVAMFGFAIIGISLKWAVNTLIPATDSREWGHVTFAVVNGAMLPALAWCVNRALRYQWMTANLSSISVAMQAGSQRLQQAYSKT